MTRLWMLPDGVEEALPNTAWRVESLRRALLDHYRSQSYELILPPLIEHLDTLLSGAGSDLEDQTFKLTDPVGGRLLGLRADMTPQATRIAARHFADVPVVRLCYLGTVLRTRPDSLGGSRAPRQVGCEVFGEASLSADLEILRLMLDTLRLAGIGDAHIDLGHVGIYRALAARLKLDEDDETAVFDILQRKSQPDLRDFAAARQLPAKAAAGLSALMELNGDVSVLQRARQTLDISDPQIADALSALEQAAAHLAALDNASPLHIDLAELRGYRYQTGLVFAAFVPGHGREVARGGRFDDIGAARPATGFSADVNELLRLGNSI
ncbi:ATP phosphoribosyltransferase regulatory subunit [Nevskia ramosa]|uniref:ATP phosphoribosyltransferase regulatory subunit n=1 Tax=Nevskia ramosa TaxID=64002 RepID=UPI003D10511A